MGKIRVKTLGDETFEKEQKKESKKRQEAKKLAKAPGLKGGERVVAVGPTEEELATTETLKQDETQNVSASEKLSDSAVARKHAKKKTTSKKRSRSKKYQVVAKLVDRNKLYPLSEALTLLPKLKLSKFDESVELHINTLEAGISGNLTLPHGTGKKIRVAVANDTLLASIEKGKIDFDVLLANPEMMPKLAKFAKFLGPRGLMPNPKNGTITANPEEAAKKYEAGQIRYKTESKLPVIHLSVGKLSFGENKLSENIKTVISTIQPQNIEKVTIKSTMSPGIKLNLNHKTA